MKIIKSNVAPSPLEARYWADLSANAYGNVIKSWNGKSWVNLNDSTSSDQSVEIKAILEALDTKVDKVSGKVLSDNNYTTVEKNKLSSLSNYNDQALRQLISDLTIRVAALENEPAA